MKGKGHPYGALTLEANQVKLFIRNLEPTYKHLRFTPFENFITLRNVCMLVEEDLARKTSTKATTKWKNNYCNKGKKHSGSISKEVHGLNHYTEYTPIGTTYAKALGRLLLKGMIDLPLIKPEMESTQKSKNWDLNKYCKYH